MTSIHRLLAIILVWLVVAFLGAMMPGLALSVPSWMALSLYLALLAAASIATWAIARART